MAFFCVEWLSSDEVLKTFAAIQLSQASEPVKMSLPVVLSSKFKFCVK